MIFCNMHYRLPKLCYNFNGFAECISVCIKSASQCVLIVNTMCLKSDTVVFSHEPSEQECASQCVLRVILLCEQDSASQCVLRVMLLCQQESASQCKSGTVV